METMNEGRAAVAAAAVAPVLAAGLGALSPTPAHACACGCYLFDVGTASMYPSDTGLMVFAEEDVLDQNRNWSGTGSSPAAANPDKRIHSEFFTVGAEYQVDRRWGVQVEVPYWNREFRTTADDASSVDFTHAALGDVRIRGIYTGFSDDLSTGLTFGVKLPTGDSSYPNFDPDTEIGSGSTDLLLGGYHLGALGRDGEWRYFAQVQWDRPLAHKASYLPGDETVVALGAYYNGWQLTDAVKIAPILQLDGSVRGRDGGVGGDPYNTGYSRLFVLPGLQANVGRLSIYADTGFLLYANVVGQQLVARHTFRVNLSYHF